MSVVVGSCGDIYSKNLKEFQDVTNIDKSKEEKRLLHLSLDTQIKEVAKNSFEILLGNRLKDVKSWTPNRVFDLAQAYHFGIGVQASPIEAKRLYYIAAEKGNSSASLFLSQYYFNNFKKESLKENKEIAFNKSRFYLLKAVKQGSIKAIRVVLNLIKKEKDLKETPQLLTFNFSGSEIPTGKFQYKIFMQYKKKATTAEEEEAHNALTNLGDCHQYGVGTPVNLELAEAYYKLAAFLGDDAMSWYALVDFCIKNLRSKEGLSATNVKFCLLKAAEKGHMRALEFIRYIYRHNCIHGKKPSTGGGRSEGGEGRDCVGNVSEIKNKHSNFLGYQQSYQQPYHIIDDLPSLDKLKAFNFTKDTLQSVTLSESITASEPEIVVEEPLLENFACCFK